MRKTFPKYKRGSLANIEKSFSEKDKALINKYLIFCGGSGGKTTIAKYHSVLVKIVDVFGGDMDKIDLDRLRLFLEVLKSANLLPPTKNEIKKVLKRFLKENYDDWSLRFKGLNEPAFKGEKEYNEEKINANTILRKEEIEKLVRASESLKYKAFIMTMYESASRPEELLKVKWKDINLVEGDIKLVSSKTGNLRINPLQNSLLHLKRYKEEYTFPEVTGEDYVFVNPQKRGSHISRVATGLYIKRLGKKVLNRDIFMYLIRHTRATELQKVLPPKIYEKFMDHSLATATRYSHLNKKDVRESMFKNVYEVKDISPEKKHELEKELDKLKELVHNQNKLSKNQNKEIKKAVNQNEKVELLIKEVERLSALLK